MRVFWCAVFFCVIFALSSCGGSRSSSNNNLEGYEDSVVTETDSFLLQGASGHIAHFLQNDYLTEADKRSIQDSDRVFDLGAVDLNGDGQDEYFVSLPGSYFSGSGGGTYLLFSHDLKPIDTFTVTRAPFYVPKEKKEGWKELIVYSDGSLRKLVYEDGHYPSNPSLEPKVEGIDIQDYNVIFPDSIAPKQYKF